MSIQNKRKPVGLFTVLTSFGFSKYLFSILFACAIWGLFPLFYTTPITNFADESPALFLFFRYIPAIILFLLMLLFMLTRGFTTINNISSFFKKYWSNMLLMGCLLFIGRMFEIKAYIDESYINFAIIYCVFLAIVFDCKGWFVSWIMKKVKIKEKKHNSYLMESLKYSFLVPLQNINDFIFWAVQTTLVFISGFFLLYFQDGELPKFGSLFFERGEFGPMFWCLLSALCLNLFFDQMAWLREEEQPETNKENIGFAVKSQLGTAICFLFFASAFSIYSILLDGPQCTNSKISFILNNWEASSYLYFIFGISIAGTFLAYLAEGFGAAAHDNSKTYLDNWKISGREWLSIMANFDPLIASFVILLLGNYAKSATGWIIIPLFSIITVGLLTFSKLWSKKSSEIRRETFTKEFENSNINLSEKAKNLTYLLHYEADFEEIEANIMRNKQDVDKILSISSREQYVTLNNLPKVLTSFLKDGERFYSQLSELPRSSKPECVMFFIKNGKKWFDRYNLECNAVFEVHKKNLIRNFGNSILRIEEMIAFMNSEDNQFIDVDKTYEKYKIDKAIKEYLIQEGQIRDDREGKDILPLIIYNNKENEKDTAIAGYDSNIQWTVIGDYNTLLQCYECDEKTEKDKITKRLVKNLNKKGINESDLEHLFIIQKDVKEMNDINSDDTTDWILLHDAVLNELDKRPEIIPDWLIHKKIILFCYEWFLPQSYRNIGVPINTRFPYFSLRNSSAENVREAIIMADKRYYIAPCLYIIDDMEQIREHYLNYVKQGLLGTNGKIIIPENYDEVESYLNNLDNMKKVPLIFLDNNLSKWKDGLFGTDLIKPYFKKADSYLVTQLGGLYPNSRKCSNDKYHMMAKIAEHCGVRGRYGEYTIWSVQFNSIQKLLEDWDKFIISISKNKKDGTSNKYCHDLFLSHANKKKEKP